MPFSSITPKSGLFKICSDELQSPLDASGSILHKRCLVGPGDHLSWKKLADAGSARNAMYISGGEEKLWNSHQSGNDILYSVVLEIEFEIYDARNSVTSHRLRESGNSKVHDVRGWITAKATSHNLSLKSNEIINAIT